ncbi:Methylthioribose-1-phosphate isomerase [Gossypium arboreum]|uniref:Methylthioribose-1-phosphate isomerase n=1 Tax=Gossypium arboreum TaxID=29729 RepID=A0A0B0PHV1_GOSAR|nr:Methylthioribose-1-phosphate isomerase [Gossypium arboreum]
MNPYDEKRLRDEVIYLHYLWEQGPPQTTNQTLPKRPRPSTQNPINRRKFAHSGSHPPPKPDPGLDWSVLLKPTSPSSPGWPEPKSKPDPMVRPVSIEDQARGYYEENHEKGEFFCLVCGGIGENLGKKFQGCVGLVQHCMSISKTKCKTGHRAFGLVVCKVLGWDIDRLPVILLKGEPLSRILANSRESQNTLQGEGSDKNVKNLETGNSSGEVRKDGSDSLDKEDDLTGDVEFMNADGNGSVKKEVFSNDQSNGELMACNMSNNFLEEEDANENVESLEISDGEPNKGSVNDLGLGSSQVTTTGWPCIESIDVSTSTTPEWPSFEPCTASITHVISAEEQIRINMVQWQLNVFDACKQFLSKTAGSDIDEDDNEFNEDDLMDDDGSNDSNEFNFFLRLFTENDELRSYYETYCRDGDFWCLVCRGIGKKDWRIFKDCVGLIQHSTAISKTKRKQAHRAFGQVICKVLNWDFDRLPSIMLKNKPYSHSINHALTDKSKSESGSKEDVDAHQNNSLLMNSENTLNEEPGKDANLENRALNIGANEDKPENPMNSSGKNNTNSEVDQ